MNAEPEYLWTNQLAPRRSDAVIHATTAEVAYLRSMTRRHIARPGGDHAHDVTWRTFHEAYCGGAFRTAGAWKREEYPGWDYDPPVCKKCERLHARATEAVSQ